ncbi:MAG: glycosyltransferase, partial [Acidimicrobiales bacterium]
MKIPLHARQDLRPSADDEHGSNHRITGGRPRFELTETPGPGWYAVSTDVAGTTSHVELESHGDAPVALRFLPRTGAVVLARRPIPTVAGRRTRVMYVPQGTARIEVEVSPWLDSVVATHVRFRRLPAAVAAATMAVDVSASGIAGSTDGRALLGDLKAANAGRGVRGVIEQTAIAYEHLQHRRAGDGVDYPSWRIRNATMFDDDADRLRARLATLPDGGPTISVVMPVYDPEDKWLRAAIESVRSQTYDQWQLCLVNDASPRPGTREILDEYAALDERVLVRHRPTNGHIVAATNDGIGMATGEFVAFMDHDDELAPFALGVIAL